MSSLNTSSLEKEAAKQSVDVSTAGSCQEQSRPDQSKLWNSDEERTDEPRADSSPWSSASVVAALCLATFCVALDSTIIATAIPRISDHFQALNDVGWYASAYLFTTCAFQLSFGKLYSMYPNKGIFMASLALFEIGSLVCAIAPTSAAFIVGRALAGIGAAGVITGGVIIVSAIVPPAQRSAYIAMMGSIFGFSGVVGPIIGGALTDKVSWRWCFYLNLPVGGAAAVVLLILLQTKEQAHSRPATWWAQVRALDPIGNVSFLASIICLLLALQLGGTADAWSSGPIIALFVVFAVLLASFIVSQWWARNSANTTLPAAVISQRSVAFGAVFAFCIGAAFFTVTYYIPFYLQVIKGASPLQSGVDLLPLVGAWVVATLLAGTLTVKIGYYMPFVFLSVVLMAIGTGLFTTLAITSSTATWVGYQIVFGLGAGLGFQQATIAAQSVLPSHQAPIGTAFAIFSLFFGSAVFVSAANNLFTNELVSHIIASGVTGVDTSRIISVGATQVRGLVGAAQLPAVLDAFMAALVDVYRLALVLASTSLLGAVGMEWIDVRKIAQP